MQTYTQQLEKVIINNMLQVMILAVMDYSQ
jgi:hypothetical protein